MKRECALCGNRCEAVSKIEIITKATRGLSLDKCKRIICLHYPNSETNACAYERHIGIDECFKEKYSCCNCIHRFYSRELSEYYCRFDYLDNNRGEMYYLEPINNNGKKEQITIRYWVCPVCKAKNEISKNEKIVEESL